jgi:hypothetical protein
MDINLTVDETEARLILDALRDLSRVIWAPRQLEVDRLQRYVADKLHEEISK